MPASLPDDTPSEVKVQIKYLVNLRERSGCREEEVCFPPGARLQDVAEWVGTRHGLVLPDPQIMATLNGKGWEQFPAKLSTELKTGDAICFFPLLSGG